MNAFDPTNAYLFLQDGGGVLDVPDPPAFWSEVMGATEMSARTRAVAEGGGWLAGSYPITEDTRHWEMHPEGNELLFLSAGAVDVIFEHPAQVASLKQGQACLVPQGVWHRIVVHHPGDLLAVTYGRGTQHKALQ